MKLVAIPEPQRKGNIEPPTPNLYHFNLEGKDGVHHYTIGPEPVEVPDYDAKAILAHIRIRVYEEPLAPEDTPKVEEKPGRGRRSKEAD